MTHLEAQIIAERLLSDYEGTCDSERGVERRNLIHRLADAILAGYLKQPEAAHGATDGEDDQLPLSFEGNPSEQL